MKKRSQFASRNYPNIYRYAGHKTWAFRKYSSIKQKNFFKETGETEEAKAYSVGLEAFNQFVTSKVRDRADTNFRTIALDVLESKEGGKHNTFRTSKNQIKNHLVPAFGHLKPNQITRLKWEKWIAEERRRPEGIRKFFNAHKAIMEILRRSLEEGLIERVPELQSPDVQGETGQHLEDSVVRDLIAHSSPDTQLLIETMWRMGPRPGELVQWEFDMIDWRDGPNGSIDIPGRITKTGRSRKIPLNGQVSKLIKEREKGSGSRFIFPSPIHSNRAIREYKTGFEAACRRMVCPKVCEKVKKQGGWTCKKICHDKAFPAVPYDLRHTFITNQARAGRSIIDVARYCDTSPKMIQKIYAKSLKGSMQEIAG